MFDISSLKVTYFCENKKLWYINSVNNEKNDLFFEFWGANDNMRYFTGMNSTTGEEIYFGQEKIKKIQTNLDLIYHELIIVGSNDNDENSIFSMNSYYFEFIDLKHNFYNCVTTDHVQGSNNPSMRNSIIKLNNNNFLLASVIYINEHNLFMLNFNFTSNDIFSFNQINKAYVHVDYINSTSCFQTNNSYIQCSYNKVDYIFRDVFAVGIFNLNLEEKNNEDISYVYDNTFTKMFHINNNIGAYIFFDNDNLPNIKIKNLNTENFKLQNVFNFESIILNENGKYNQFNTDIYYSDGIKINDEKFFVILTMRDLSNLLICVFDIFDNNSSLRLRYFDLGLDKIGIKIGVNIRAFKFNNFLGIMLYNSNNEYPGYSLLNFPNYNNENDFINNTKIEIKLFKNSTSYNFSLSEITMTNNLFGEEISGIKIINFKNISLSGVKINSSKLNSELYIEEELDIEDQLIFYPSETGAIPGKYLLYFSTIIKEPRNDIAESYSNMTKYYGSDTQNNYEPHIYIGNVLGINYVIECHEKCKNCSIMGSESNYYCLKCVDEYPYIINNGEKCEDRCNNYIDEKNGDKYCIEKCNGEQYIYIKNENEKYCIEDCTEGQFKYVLNENKKFCLSTCNFNGSELYSDEENKLCYNSCSENNYGKIYSYENKCVLNCPIEYIPYVDNICIEKEEITQNTIVESLLVDIDKSETNIITTIISSLITSIESSIIENMDTNIDSSIIGNEETNIDSSELNGIAQTNIVTDINEEIKENININSTFLESTSSISVYDIISEIEPIENDKSQIIINNDIDSMIDDYIKNGKNSELEVKLINNDTIISLYSSQSDLDTLIELNPNLTYIDLLDCKNLLISENKLDENSELLILGKETKNNAEISVTNNFTYEIYSTSGEKINDLSICQDSNIEISSPIINLDMINYEEALILIEQGYDIYNTSSSFYYDYCLSTYINGSDLTLDIRQQEFYPNVSLCQNGCSYNGFDLDNKRVNCICNSNSEEINEIENYKEEVEENFFSYILDMINYQIITCYTNFFDYNNYFHNYGFYTGFCLLLIILVSMIVFIFYGNNIVKRQFLHKEPDMKRIKELEIKFNKNIETKNVIYHKKNKIKKFHKKSKFYKNEFFINNLISNPLKKKKFRKKKRKFKFRKMKPKSSVDIILKISGEETSLKKFSSNYDNVYKTNKMINRIILNTVVNEKNSQNIEYNELPYNDALEQDKRNVVRVFLSFFYLKIKIIQILFYKKDFSHYSLVFSFYFFEIILDLTINSLLFSDDVISQKYFNNGELLLITTNMLSVSSIIISYFILLFTEKLINHNLVLDEVCKEIKDSNEYYFVYLKLLCCFKFKLTIFYFIILFIGFFCTYYLFVFCAIFKKIQKNLFINYIIGNFWSLGFTIIVCLFATITRKIALKHKIKRLYIISKYIDDKF